MTDYCSRPGCNKARHDSLHTQYAACQREARDRGDAGCMLGENFPPHHVFVEATPADPYVEASKKVREAALLLADVDYIVADHLHSVSQEVFEAKPKPPKPDIILPDEHYGNPQNQPVPTLIHLDGLVLKVVNWLDYRGWEVRIHSKYASSSGAPEVLGYLFGADDKWGIRKPDGSGEQRGIARKDEALRVMTGHEWRA